MIYHYEDIRLTWGEMYKLRFANFPSLAPAISYYGDKLRIPFPFQEIQVDENTNCTYQLSIINNKIREKVIVLGSNNEFIQHEIDVCEEDAKKLAEAIILSKNNMYLYLIGNTPEETADAISFLVSQRSKSALDISTFKSDFQTKILLKLVDRENSFKRIHDSEILLTCYANAFTTLAFVEGKDLELQQKTFDTFMELFEENKLELLMKVSR